ncbi:copper resistance CopC family protein [Gulosibacter molinativorax]|uniref:Copper resistance protein CopC n=1 Tax=Gulosibacter molinativorax TaxID=256821 RepID=A0ABT7C8S9_9MICO|nr:copper resistance CopC family protein [Gulosibacter molinativorax]MDJ1371505.1 copper resistance protein CopC [Gulosibacter molinativorax]QUY62447.1 Uncharacterized protein, copper resistance protein CopC-like protein [Gulosibacter molinativorax]
MLQRIRTTRSALLALLVSVALLVAIPVSGIASAHDQLVESDPVEGQEFDAAPTEATLRFSAEMLEIGTELALQNADTEEFVELPGAYVVDYDTVTQPLPELPAGAYTLNWRVVSQDGHPISGAIHFTVTGGTAAGSAEATDGATADAAEATGGFGNVPVESEAPQPSGKSTPANPGGALSEPWMVVTLSVVAVLVAAGAIVTFVMRMRRGNKPGE